MMEATYKRPNYDTARWEAGFNWYIDFGPNSLMKLTGIPMREFFLNPAACIEVYRKGRPMLREIYGSLLNYEGLSTPAIGYGHINCLGAKLVFPEDGEVYREHLYSSLNEGIAALAKDVDFASAGMFPFYLDFWKKLKAEFPGESVGFSFSVQGPVTTAWLLRGEAFFEDLYDAPEAVKEFLRRVTASVVKYHHCLARVQGAPEINPNAGGVCDDIASLIPPRLWPAFVMPYLEQYFRGKTTGTRGAHIENLRPDHLKYLEMLGLNRYDPSVSPELKPATIYKECRVPFAWRLVNFQYASMRPQDVSDFVFAAVADGASTVFSDVAEDMLDDESVRKVRAFVEACREAERQIKGGLQRSELRQMMSPAKQKSYRTVGQE